MKRANIPFIFIPYKILCILLFEPDPSIAIVNRVGKTPYGLLWQAINWPSFFDLHLWVWYLLPIDIALSYLLWKHFPLRIIYPFTIYNLWLWWDEYSNLSVEWFTQFGYLNPVFILLSILTKIPLPFQTASWNYAFGSTWRFFSIPRMISYSLIGYSWFYSFMMWLKK